VKFILATTDPLKLPATILSRTQHYRFTKIEPTLIKNHLEYILAKESVEFDNKAIELLAKSGNGSLRDTITLLDQAIAYSKGNITLDRVVDMLGVINPEIIDKIFTLVLNQKKDEIKEIIKEIADYDIESILDEIMEYLKDALFNNRFSMVTIERFFKIVVDIKELIKINVENEFVLTLMFFKMIEATKPHKIDELIAEFEKNINTTNKVDLPKQEIIPPVIEKPTTLFEKLKKEILDRDEEIYKCFEDVKFISFENNTLIWESCVDENCKKLLRKYWGSVIKVIIDDIFGIGTKVVPEKCSKNIEIVQPQKEVIIQDVEKPQDYSQKIVQKTREVFGDDIMEINIYKNKN